MRWVGAYAQSPIDLIPDFIPVIGFLDDLRLLPLGIGRAIRLIPQPVCKECQALAVELTLDIPRNPQAAIVIFIIWVLAIAGFMFWAWQFVGGAKST